MLFYIRTHWNDPANQGVVQKYLGMARALERAGEKVSLVFLGDRGLLKDDQPWKKMPFSTRKGSLGHILLFYFLPTGSCCTTPFFQKMTASTSGIFPCIQGLSGFCSACGASTQD
ncbi:MAG: hypothetical protein IPL65_18435 [Lewinellaceae bacterium]|nr:hypothetical protein [Lewinellaceae bacterium]